MQMSDIRILEVVLGPGPMAYDFDKQSGTLTVWSKEYVDEAPETAVKVEIIEGHKTWSMFDMLEDIPFDLDTMESAVQACVADDFEDL